MSDRPSAPGSLPSDADVAFVTDLLAGLPRPAMPPDVTARLEQAIATGTVTPGPTPAGYPRPRERRRVLPWLAAAAALVALAGIGAQYLGGRGSTGSQAATAASNGGDELNGMGDLVARSLAAQTAQAAPTGNLAGNLAGTFAATPAGLQSCLAGLGRTGAVPLLVSLEDYAGTAVVALALPGASAGTSDMYVVGTDCTTASPHLLGRRTLQLSPAPTPG